MGTPWQILANWVIDGMGQAKLLYQVGDTGSRMQAMALWQFLNFCREQPGGAGAPCTRLLERVRRLVLLSEDRGLRRPPGPAEGIDAVRLMTIHGSKGLEFHSVHIPGLVATGLLRSNRPPRCLPPDGLFHGSAELDRSRAQPVRALPTSLSLHPCHAAWRPPCRDGLHEDVDADRKLTI